MAELNAHRRRDYENQSFDCRWHDAGAQSYIVETGNQRLLYDRATIGELQRLLTHSRPQA
jgi:hypothetical protein